METDITGSLKKTILNLGIRPTDFVLDIGPGSSPFEMADVLVDRWPGSEGVGQTSGYGFYGEVL